MEHSFLNYYEKLGQAAVSLFELYLCHMPLNAVTSISSTPAARNHFRPHFFWGGNVNTLLNGWFREEKNVCPC